MGIISKTPTISPSGGASKQSPHHLLHGTVGYLELCAKTGCGFCCQPGNSTSVVVIEWRLFLRSHVESAETKRKFVDVSTWVLAEEVL